MSLRGELERQKSLSPVPEICESVSADDSTLSLPGSDDSAAVSDLEMIAQLDLNEKEEDAGATMWDTRTAEDGKSFLHKPLFDLAKKTTALVHIQTIKLKGLPQSVSCSLDPDSSLVLVTDIEHNKILKFRGIEPDGEWKPCDVVFQLPRYVLLLPEDQVAVLDNKALYIFELNGKLLRKLLEGEAKNYRGLSLYRQYNRIVSTRKDAGTALAIIHYGDSQPGVAATISLPWFVSNARVRYLSCRNGFVYSTDMDLGQIYSTCIRTRTTIVHKCMADDGQNYLKQPLGVDIDPAGNILVSSFGTGKLLLLSPEGDLRHFRVPEVKGPCGLAITHNFVYVVDSQSKQLCIYIATDIDSQ